jgi:hypothetical protein
MKAVCASLSVKKNRSEKKRFYFFVSKKKFPAASARIRRWRQHRARHLAFICGGVMHQAISRAAAP